jgi:hypothetical protein
MIGGNAATAEMRHSERPGHAVVSTSSDNRSAGGLAGAAPEPGRYRRRRPLPGVVFLAVLAVVVVAVWVQVLTKHNDAASTSICPLPTSASGSSTIEVGTPPATLGNKINPDDLTQTPPAAPKATQVRVLNANGQRGQAALVAAQLAQLGLAPAPDMASGNDTVYTSQNMQCHAQIRFGLAGVPAARTIELLVPCAELVQDMRKDGIVDLALGTDFTAINTDANVSAALTALTKHASDPQSPAPDAAALSAARDVAC